MDLGETRAQAAAREAKEELDCDVEVLREIQTVDLIKDGKHWVSTHFACRILAGTPRITEPDKCDELRWFTLDEAAAVPLAGYMPPLLEKLGNAA